jgi:AcrR family transcriptional regulator
MAERSPDSKERILRTFAEMVAEHGYDTVSLSMVAGHLGISKGTIVHHYGTKDRMLEAIHHEYMTRRMAEAKEIAARFDDPAQLLTAFIAQLLITERDDRAATVAFAREIARFSQLDLMRDVRRMRATYAQLVNDAIDRGMKQGLFRQDDSELVTLQVFGMCNWSWTWMRPDIRWQVKEIASTWITTLLLGLLAQPEELGFDIDEIVTTVEQIVADPQVNGARRVAAA